MSIYIIDYYFRALIEYNAPSTINAAEECLTHEKGSSNESWNKGYGRNKELRAWKYKEYQ